MTSITRCWAGGWRCVCHRFLACRSRPSRAGRARLAFQIGHTMSCPAPSGAAGAALAPRKRQALELFRGLPRRYDALSAALSFWQDPRWRRALVDAVAPRAGESRARRRDRHGDGGRRAALALRVLGRGRSTRAPRCSPRARAALRRRRRASRVELVEGAGRGAAVRRRELRRAHRSPTCCATSMTRPRRCASWPACCARAAASASLEFGVPPWPPARAAWRLYTAVGLPLLGRLASREWCEVGRFLGPSIRGFYERHPLERVVGYWRAGGPARRARAPDELRRRRRDVARAGRAERPASAACGAACGAARGARPSGRPSTRSAAGALGDAADAAASALHGRGTSATSRSARRRRRTCTSTACCGASPAFALAVGRGGARARRAPRPAAAHRPQRPHAARAGRRRACSARSRSGSAGVAHRHAVAGAARARRRRCSCRRTTSS